MQPCCKCCRSICCKKKMICTDLSSSENLCIQIVPPHNTITALSLPCCSACHYYPSARPAPTSYFCCSAEIYGVPVQPALRKPCIIDYKTGNTGSPLSTTTWNQIYSAILQYILNMMMLIWMCLYVGGRSVWPPLIISLRKHNDMLRNVSSKHIQQVQTLNNWE